MTPFAQPTKLTGVSVSSSKSRAEPSGAVTMQPAELAERGESPAGVNDRRHVRLSQPLLDVERCFGPTGRSPSA